ncbi:MAG: hypothetical protein KJ887_04270 [Candidatus Omnitrophica bacterium]|nr:hypothetical protein [Candidatus Omnitrophota bacterium]MBU1630614.1 hypothetical protein [Candidatus Omnitrophota bacterium]
MWQLLYNYLIIKKRIIVKLIACFWLIPMLIGTFRGFANMIPHSSRYPSQTLFTLILTYIFILVGIGLFNFKERARKIILVMYWIFVIVYALSLLILLTSHPESSFNWMAGNTFTARIMPIINMLVCVFSIWFLRIDKVREEFKVEKIWALLRNKVYIHLFVVMFILMIALLDNVRYKNEVEDFFDTGGVITNADISYKLDRSKMYKSSVDKKRKCSVGYEFYVNKKGYKRTAKIGQDAFNLIADKDKIQIAYSSKNPNINFYIEEETYKNKVVNK